MKTPARLAIVIPAYKATFLRATLESIAAQTDRRFHVYIGDDASPGPIAGIASGFSNKMPVSYVRFGENLGGRSLVRHWERCLELSWEPWIWLFSDDDLMAPECVATFYRELEATGGDHDLYRFNTVSIDRDGKMLAQNTPHPRDETGADFLLARLRGGRNSTMQELIFSRAAWERVAGIPEFPLAWASDDAFIALLGSRKLIRTMDGPRVQWRLSGENISEKKSPLIADEKIRATRIFLDWAFQFLKNHVPSTGELSTAESNRLAEDWFFRQLVFMRNRLNWRRCLEIDELASTLWDRWKGYGFLKSLKFNVNLARSRVFDP
jgi:glycosyltransferase involved in cell wall biosynthesis